MNKAQDCKSVVKVASTFRDGLMIAFLAARPVRISNLADIELDRHAERQGEFYWLVYPAKEMKNRRALEFPLPREMTVSMQQYLELYRPLLLSRTGRWNRGSHDGLWVSRDGSKLVRGRIREIVARHTERRIGWAINPHLFRDAAATSVAIEDPEHVGIVAAILGHGDYRTAERYYNQADALAASRRYHQVLESLRNQAA